eukprot:TRINITY_DN25099_c0_g1_i1.p1 TRINITY_DN25099_c0_g1~~TRINITY_DN25099_c0_g1_i1.p1  ORF type:complete len:273 (+),score=34.29 TRINITY_DN25099_c0_g1_i1:47-820(+)
MEEIRITAQKSVGFYKRLVAGILSGTEAKAPADEICVLALGNAIPVAVAVVDHISSTGIGDVTKIDTGNHDESGNGRTCPRLVVAMRRNTSFCDAAIFLDVDGVLNTIDGDDLFLPHCMQRLKDIVTGSSAMLVLSSSWREHKKEWQLLNDELAKFAIDPIVESTPVSRCGTETNFESRSDEILDWLNWHPRVRRFVALDDSDLLDPHGEAFGKHFVRTASDTGLTDANVSAALQVLKRSVDRSTLPAPLRRASEPE